MRTSRTLLLFALMVDQTLRKLSEVLQGDVGVVLRAERLRRGVSLRSLAKRVGISASAMSQIETGRSRPSVGTLYAVTDELGISLDELFASVGSTTAGARPVAALKASVGAPKRALDAPDAAQARASSNDHSPIQRASARRAITLDSGVRWERLTVASDRGVDFLRVSYGVGSASNPDRLPIRHSGREYGLILSGRLRVTIAFESFDLGPGDSISFDSSSPHLLENVSDDPVQAVWIVVGRGGDGRVADANGWAAGSNYAAS